MNTELDSEKESLIIKLQKKVIGQHMPIKAICSAMIRKKNGWHDEDRPLVFLFLGPSGVGKTELVKQLASYVHKDNKNGFIRVDMSEYQSKHEVAKFIGSPPGYVGHESGGQLSRKLTECNNAVVLLDEVEKAHIDVLNIMLQVFDEGRLMDGKGVEVNCKDAIFIMTSNLCQQEIVDEGLKIRKLEKEAKENQTLKENLCSKRYNKLSANVANLGKLKDVFESDKNFSEDIEMSKHFVDKIIYPLLKAHFKRDEFLGRISEILYFLPFTDEEIKDLIEIELLKWLKIALKRNQITLSWSIKVLKYLKGGYNIKFGARSLKYEVVKKIINPIALAHENKVIVKGSDAYIFINKKKKIDFKFTKYPSNGISNKQNKIKYYYF